MNDAALIGAHGLQTDLTALAHRLVCRLLRHAAEGLLALLAVILAVHDHALIVLAPGVRHRARQALQSVQNEPSLADDGVGICRFEVDLDLLVLAHETGDGVDGEAFQKPFQKRHGAFSVGSFLLREHADARLDRPDAEESDLALFQHFRLQFFGGDARRGDGGGKRFFHGLACKFS